MLIFACVGGMCLVSLNGCGGGGGKSAAKYDASAVQPQQATTTQDDTTAATSATSTAGALCDKSSGVSISWYAEHYGDGRLVDLDYHGYNLARQVEVRGIATGETVIVKPFGNASSSFATTTSSATGTALTATDTTLFATSITPYNGYAVSSITLESATDSQGVPYYRGWIHLPPWAESSQLPDRMVFMPIITWSGGSYTACETAEKLEIGAKHCYGLTYWDADCLPATPTTQVTPASGTTAMAYTVNCVAGPGTVYAIEARCDTASAWTPVWEGTSIQCRYAAAGTYTPACRFDYTQADDADEPITVTAPAAAAPRMRPGAVSLLPLRKRFVYLAPPA